MYLDVIQIISLGKCVQFEISINIANHKCIFYNNICQSILTMLSLVAKLSQIYNCLQKGKGRSNHHICVWMIGYSKVAKPVQNSQRNIPVMFGSADKRLD